MKFKVGIIGSGFIAKNLYNISKNTDKFKISKLLTRSKIKDRNDFDKSLLTNDLNYIIKNSDLVFDCTGDAIHSTDVIYEIMKYNIPIVTMNSELHVTIGDYFNKLGFITEADGDQPASLATLNNQLNEMNFNPIVYGIHKGFINYNPNKKDMLYWSNKNKISENKTISFTDGSKVTIESIFVANALDCYISNKKFKSNIDKLNHLHKLNKKTNNKYVDFFVDSKSSPGVFITCTHNKDQNKVLEYLKLGKNYYTIEKPYHLCHLEAFKTIKDILNNKKILMNTKVNRYMPAAITKRELKAGTIITEGLGSYDFRCISEIKNIKLVPITLLKNCIIKKNIKENCIVTMDDVELPNTRALSIWKNLK